jgi:hypothetical protein
MSDPVHQTPQPQLSFTERSMKVVETYRDEELTKAMNIFFEKGRMEQKELMWVVMIALEPQEFNMKIPKEKHKDLQEKLDELIDRPTMATKECTKRLRTIIFPRK